MEMRINAFSLRNNDNILPAFRLPTRWGKGEKNRPLLWQMYDEERQVRCRGMTPCKCAWLSGSVV